jgi:hypothetical protein
MTASEERALLLANANTIDVELVRGLLSAADIPCVIEGPDFDVAELGRSAHDMIRGQSVFVPRSALERAQEVLDRAWGDGAREFDEGFEPGEPESEAAGAPASGRAPRARSSWLTFGLLALVLVLGYLWLDTRAKLLSAEQGDAFFDLRFEDDRIVYLWPANGELASEVWDANGDGVPELVRWYDPDGVESAESEDPDEDGIWNVSRYYDRAGRHSHTAFDDDGDGRVDHTIEYRPDGARVELFDRDHDSFWERREVYDAEGELVLTEEDRGLDGWVESSD